MIGAQRRHLSKFFSPSEGVAGKDECVGRETSCTILNANSGNKEGKDGGVHAHWENKG